jgi:Tfp pilus assembly protein FimT
MALALLFDGRGPTVEKAAEESRKSSQHDRGGPNLMNNQATIEKTQSWHSASGHSVIETLVVVAIAAVLGAVAVPQMIHARRLMRSAALPREVVAQLRFTKQQAMSQRQAFTFQYDDSTKQIRIIDHNNNGNPNPACNVLGKDIVADALYPDTACSVTVLTVALGGGAVPAADISIGVPSSLSGVSTLDDTSTPTSLTPGGKLNINFQPNGSVIDVNGNPVNNRTIFLYNNRVPTETAVAISVLGSAGRVKVWRYSSSVNKYAE